MIDLLKKTILIGIGLASLTKEKMEELTDELVKKGEMSEKEGRELVDDLLNRSKEARKELDSRIEKIVADALDRFNVPNRKEIAELRQRIAVLEQESAQRAERETFDQV